MSRSLSFSQEILEKRTHKESEKYIHIYLWRKCPLFASIHDAFVEAGSTFVLPNPVTKTKA